MQYSWLIVVADKVEKIQFTCVTEVLYYFTYRESLRYVTKYLQPENGASSLCEVTLKDFLPIKNVIPSVFCYFPDLRLTFNIF